MRLELLKLQGKEFTGKTISQESKLPEMLFYIRIFLVVLNEDGKKVCGGFLSWLFHSVLLAPNTEGNPKMFGSCPWCCPPASVGDGFQKKLFLKDQCPVYF